MSLTDDNGQNGQGPVTARITITSPVPQHIRKEWLPVAARLQQFSNTQAGVAIVSIQVVVDENGNPICWMEPKMVRIEPRSRQKIIRDLFFGPQDALDGP